MFIPKKTEEIEEEFGRKLRFLSGSSVGVAVSGGGDSLALLVLASKWAKLFEKNLKVVTVDHHLREGSRNEAVSVGEIANELGHTHTILDWRCNYRKGNLQAKAAMARKQLISQWAKEKFIETVLLGHTLDDQAETFLMRLARGSGVDGLSGIRRSKKSVWDRLV